MINENITTSKVTPLVSIVVPAYNEEALIEKNMNVICDYMEKLEDQFRWELIVINDGSKDKTGMIADSIASRRKNIIVCHHKANLYLGHALRTGFCKCKGDYIITLDIDLSYSPEHIKELIEKIIETDADVVIASPYMKEGRVTNVPFIRKFFSKFVNIFLAIVCNEEIHTFTGMVRAYKGSFLKHLVLKARDNEINPEIIYKTILLRGRIVEIPAHLDWSTQKLEANKRKSKIKVFRGILSGFMSGFIFRPYIFFIGLGIILMLISFYIFIWIIINIFSIYPQIVISNKYFDNQFSEAVSRVFFERPHSFFIGGVVLIVAVQFLSLGFISLQNKRYFEELFNLNTNIYKNNRINGKN